MIDLISVESWIGWPVCSAARSVHRTVRGATLLIPESQTLKTSTGWVQGYNRQAMVDCDHQIIVAQDKTTDANDVQQLETMLEECEDVNGKRLLRALADAGVLEPGKRTTCRRTDGVLYCYDQILETPEGTPREGSASRAGP